MTAEAGKRSELRTDELSAQVGEVLPAREEMQVVFNKGVKISDIGRHSATTIADGNVVFGETVTIIIKRG